MFSFLIKKKDRDAAPVEDIIQGPATDTQNNGNDDFIFVDKRGRNENPQQIPMYPPMPPAPFGTTVMYPGQPSSTPIRTAPPIPYVQGIPFVFAPELCTESTFDAIQTQVDGILALLTRQMSIDGEEEYSFALERSIESECY